MSTPHYDKSFTEHYRPRKNIHKTSASPSDKRNGNKEEGTVAPVLLQQQKQILQPGQLLTFSAYSVLLYLNDDFEGGETTFFRHDPGIRVSRRGLAPHPEDVSKLEPISRVRPRRGDILVFPHGKFRGCHPDPLHEGSLIRCGEKVIIRTDLVFAPAPRSNGGRKQYKKGKKRSNSHVDSSGAPDAGGADEKAVGPEAVSKKLKS